MEKQMVKLCRRLGTRKNTENVIRGVENWNLFSHPSV